MRDIFKIFAGKTDRIFTNNIREMDFTYCLIKIPFNGFINKENKINTILKKVFYIIENTNGDVNQYFFDTVLGLYGLPLPDKNIFRNIKNLIINLIELKELITVIVGFDKGLYGPFGYEKRKIVTVISPKLFKDYKRLLNTKENEIIVYKSILDNIDSVKFGDKITIIRD